MKWLKRVQEFAAFTKNEQRIFLFLSVVFLAGASVRFYKAHFAAQPVRQFDYTALDKEFEERSRHLTSISQASGAADSSGSKRVRSGGKRINLNAATKTDLLSLPGIGEGIAEQILIFRDEHGAFTSLDQLKKIKGIGPKKFDRLRPFVVIK